jgi:hypothetical protein
LNALALGVVTANFGPQKEQTKDGNSWMIIVLIATQAAGTTLDEVVCKEQMQMTGMKAEKEENSEAHLGAQGLTQLPIILPITGDTNFTISQTE